MALKNTVNGQYYILRKDNSPDFIQGEIYKNSNHRAYYKAGKEFTANPKQFNIPLKKYDTDYEAILLESQRDKETAIEDDKVKVIYNWVKINLKELNGIDINSFEDC